MSAEIERQLSNLIRIGIVAELDEANARVKMDVGGLITDWIPFQAARAGATRTWSAPRPGEQMMVFSPYGDTGQAVAGIPLYQEDHPAPASSKDQETTVYPDGSTVDYNSATNTLTVTVAGDAKVIINCKEAVVNTDTAAINASESVTLNTPDTNVKGKLTVDGLFTYKAGLVGSGGAGATASIVGNISLNGNMTATGAITDGNGDGGA